MTKAEWIAIAAFGVSILGGAFNIGVVYSDLQSTKAEVSKLQADQKEQQRLNTQISERLATIDVNIQFLVDRYRERKE